MKKKIDEEDKTITVQFRIEPELLEVIDDWCEKHDRTRSWLIRRALVFTFMKEIGEAKIKKWFDRLKPLY